MLWAHGCFFRDFLVLIDYIFLIIYVIVLISVSVMSLVNGCVIESSCVCVCVILPFVIRSQLQEKRDERSVKSIKPSLLHIQRFESSSFHLCLFQIFPLSGPVEGGTLLTVQGRNLGRREDAVKVSIGDAACDLLPQLYIVSVQ